MASLKTTHHWCVAASDPKLEGELAAGLDVAPLVARIMVAHGIRSVEEGRLFLTPSLERDWADPLIIPGMAEVADRVERAVRSSEPIAVFGDFDVDGITSTCLLTEALRALGARVQPFIPHRFDEGYGLTCQALDRVIEACSPSLVITVDNGIAARDEVGYLTERGIDIVVTDHHEPADLVPQGIPVTDPKIDGRGPSRELAGVGVALKLVQVLGSRLGMPELWRSFTEVAALGTVSDMMLLTPENRALVADGIAHMRTTTRPGYVALAAVTRTDLSAITADGLSFSLIPRLNAAGRMADPTLALDLLMARDPDEAASLASRLEEINQERRTIEAELTEQAEELVERTYDGGRCIIVGGEGWHEGVKGIVASRLVNRYHVPALLFSIEDGIARGSGRSVGNVNLFEAVEKCSDLLIRFGGHAGAVGVTCVAENLDALRERLDAVLAELPREDFEDRGEVAATVRLSELDIDTIRQIGMLEPFGQGNKVPLLAACGVTMCDRAVVGKTGDHMRFVATDGAASVPAIMFRVAQVDALVNCDTVVDLVFEAVAECWQGRVKPKLMVKDILCRSCSDGGRVGLPELPPLSCDASTAQNPLTDGTPCAAPAAEVPVPVDADRRAALARLPYDQLTRSLIHTMIGSATPHRAQLEALDALKGGRNTLAVMGTGRGKSLIFHVHAMREAIANGMVSVFVYPLRALVADQSFHLTSRSPNSARASACLRERPHRLFATACLTSLSLAKSISSSPRPSSSPFIATVSPSRAALGSSSWTRHITWREQRAGTAPHTSIFQRFWTSWAPPVSLPRPRRHRRTSRPRFAVLLASTTSSLTPPYATTSISMTSVISPVARTVWSPSSPPGKNAWCTSTRATSPSRFAVRCADACRNWGSASPFTTPVSAGPIAPSSNRRFVTVHSPASSPHLRSARA